MTEEKNKRSYTMSDKALEQRKAAAQSAVEQGAHTGPLTEQGKAASSRNAWKTGEYSGAHEMWKQIGMSGAMGKPCRTTCPKHPDQNKERPCTLVLDGITGPGKDCMDKTVYVKAFDDIMNVLHTENVEAVHGMLAANIAQVLEVLSMLRTAIDEHGVIMTKPLINKQGDQVGELSYLNPAIDKFNKMANDMGFNLPEMMATPRQVKKLQQKEESSRTLAESMGGLFARLSGAKRVGETIDGDAEDVCDE